MFKRGINTVRALLFMLLIIAALFSMAQRAEAAGTAKNLIVFTDKKTYSGWIYDTPQGGTTLAWEADFAADLLHILP